MVWVKFGFEEDAKTGDLTDKSRAEIEEYVEETFRKASGSREVSTEDLVMCVAGLSVAGDMVQELGCFEISTCS